MQLRAIFFDAGNTLIFPRVEELAQDLTAQGFPATVEDFYEAERRGKNKLDEWLWPRLRSGDLPATVDRVYWLEYLRALMERIGAPIETRDKLILRVAEGFKDIRIWSLVLPEAAPHLEVLREQGYVLGVISNSIGTIEEQLNRVDLGRHFDMILDSAVVGVEKPHPEIFHMALARAGIAASEAIFVGDVYSTDIGGARGAGLAGVLMDRVGAYADFGHQLDCPRIASLPELRNVIDAWQS